MFNNLDYLKEFVKKHHYDEKIHVQFNGVANCDNIKTVIFDKKNIPSERKIDIDDIKYDVDSSLPEDVFYRYLEYLDKSKSDVSYIYWMTKMDNHYEPMGIDNSESEKIRKIIYNKIEEIRKSKWI